MSAETCTPKEVNGTVVDLSTLSDNMPPDPDPEVSRENIVNTLVALLKQTHCVAIEGPEGVGKTTILSQFVRAHKTTALSVFVSSANRLSFDPENIRFDLAKQISWALNGDIIRRRDYDHSVFKSLCVDLHREAKRRKNLYYFIVDGIEELDSSIREGLLQQLVDILPTGNSQFRFLFSGDASYLKGLIIRPFLTKAYPVTLFSIDEARQLFTPNNLTQQQIREICDLSSGLPGRMAALARLIHWGKDINAAIDGISNDPEFFRMDWEQVPASDSELRRLLAILAFDTKPRTPQTLAQMLGSHDDEVLAKLKSLSFIRFDKEDRTVHYASAGLRRFMAKKLSDLKKPVNLLLIRRLSAEPQSAESLLDLPRHLEEGSNYPELLTLLTPEHMIAVLDKSESLCPFGKAA